MFFSNYPYDERMDKLADILEIEIVDDKIQSLKDFISQEQYILNNLQPPRTKSQALTAAQRQLNKIESAAGELMQENGGVNP